MSSEFGEYRLVAVIGEGGMAEVFLAVRADQLQFGVDKLVVIKRLREGLAADTDFVTMLIDEARLAARMSHPNIVRTEGVGQIDGTYYLTMEYLDGQPLHRIISTLKQAGKPTLPLVSTVLCEVLSGLEYAHTFTDFSGEPLNIVHRDITPQNVFVTYDGEVKIVDFGIAKAAGRATETRQGVIKGKIAYMSPQQAVGAEVDARADIFAVGIILNEAATGERMWKGVNALEIIKALTRDSIPASPKARNPDVSEVLDQICQKALAKEPKDRYASAADMHDDLEKFARAEGLLMKRRELGKLVATMFADKRSEVRSLVERQLGALRSKTASLRQVPIELRNSTSISRSSVTPLPAAQPSSKSSVSTRAAVVENRDERPPTPSPTAPPTAATKRSSLVFVAIAVAVLAIGVLVAVVVTDRNRGGAAAGGPAASDVPPAEKVKLTLRASPNETTFRIDDGPPLENPYMVSVPKSSTPHTITARAAGFRERIREVRFERDVTIHVILEPVGSARP